MKINVCQKWINTLFYPLQFCVSVFSFLSVLIASYFLVICLVSVITRKRYFCCINNDSRLDLSWIIYCTSGSWKLTRQHKMKTIWESNGIRFMGTMPDIILKFLILSLNRSMWILARAMSFVCVVSAFENFSFFPRKGGITSWPPLRKTSSSIVNPRSTKT